MTAKELLNHYENCGRKVKRLEEEILWEKNEIRSLDCNPINKNRHVRAQIFVAKRNIQKLEEELVKVSNERRKILDLISSVPGLEGEVLRRRYVDGEIWETICEGVHYSWNGVFRIHKRALQMVQDRLDQGSLEEKTLCV